EEIVEDAEAHPNGSPRSARGGSPGFGCFATVTAQPGPADAAEDLPSQIGVQEIGGDGGAAQCEPVAGEGAVLESRQFSTAAEQVEILTRDFTQGAGQAALQVETPTPLGPAPGHAAA